MPGENTSGSAGRYRDSGFGGASHWGGNWAPPRADRSAVSHASALVFLFAAALGAGCATPLGRAEAALGDGRFPAAAADLRAYEVRARQLPPAARARYALYRGLAELGLGNARAADRWLRVAWDADRSDPGCFDDREHGALLSAWRSTGRLPGESGRALRGSSEAP